MAMYLMLRFSITREFSDPDFDWLNNETWFRIKLLVDPYRRNYDQPMKSTSYARAVSEVFTSLKLVSSHLVHIGRVMGSKILEFLEIEGEEIRRLGNWNPSIQETCYSTKLPMIPIRALAGFSTGHGIYHNQRTVVEVPMELQRATPIGEFVFNAIGKVSEANLNRGGHDTAAMFLDFLRNMNIVFLQDIAAMMLERPERLDKDGFKHPVLLQVLDVLGSDLFLVREERGLQKSIRSLLTFMFFVLLVVQSFVETMKLALDQASTPLDCKLEAVLPAVHHRLDATHKATLDLSRTVKNLEEQMGEIKAGQHRIESGQEKQQNAMGQFLVGLGRLGRNIQEGVAPMDFDEEEEDIGSISESPHVQNTHNQAPQEPRSDDGYPSLRLLPAYGNLLQLYQHWNGVGDYRRPDGWTIGKLEETHRSKWRKKWSGAEKSQFSRASRIMLALKEEAERKTKHLDDMAIEWNETMEVIGGKFSLSRMITWLDNRSFIDRKKTRGRHTPL